MRELPIDAKAVCTDGDAGWVTDVVVDPSARAITHIVIRENNTSGREFLVPLEQVADSSRSLVRLGCQRADLSRFPEFTTTHYVPASSPEAQPVVAQMEMDAWTYSYRYEPIYTPIILPDTPVPIEEQHVPSGELAFERGAAIESSDEKLVGEIAAFIVRSDDGVISHFVVRLDESGSAREITLPLSTVEHATPAIVRLNLTQAQIERLPAMPPGGAYSSAASNPDALHLVSIVFARASQADVALHLAQEIDSKLQAAVVRKSAEGEVTARELHDVSAAGGAAVGAVLGGVLAVIAGPLGVVAGSAIGGAAGAAVGHVVDRGIPDRYIRDLGRALHAGSSALVVLVPARLEAPLLDKLAALEGQVLRLELSDEMVARLTESG